MPEQDSRIRCRYCGSNNFAGTTTCWQCNRPLLTSSKAQEPAPVSDFGQAFADRPQVQASMPSLLDRVDPLIADRSAIALGLIFPLVGYPVGIVFMMLDDSRKVQLGRLTLLWSTIGLVVSLIGTIILAAPLLAIGKQLMPSDSLSHLSLPTDGSN